MLLEEGKFYELNNGTKIEALRVMEVPVMVAGQVICEHKLEDGSTYSLSLDMYGEHCANLPNREIDLDVKKEITKGKYNE